MQSAWQNCASQPPSVAVSTPFVKAWLICWALSIRMKEQFERSGGPRPPYSFLGEAVQNFC